MTWTKLDDSFYDCPKVVHVGNEVAGAFARSLSYCGRHNTDGKLPKSIGLGVICDGKRSVLKKLLEYDFWREHGASEYLIPDYLDFNPSAEKVAAERERAAKRMRELRANGKRT
jgi:hypothetical protein